MMFEHRGHSFPLSYAHTPGREETLLYFHGLGGWKHDFEGAWGVSDWQSHTLVAFDAPGCGETGSYQPGLPLGIDDIVAAAIALVDRLELHHITVIGHSMGGLAGLLFAERLPRLVRRLVSVEGNLGPEDCSIYSRRVFRERFLGREDAFLRSLMEEMRASGAIGFAAAAEALRRNVEADAFFDYCRSIVGYSDDRSLLDSFIGLTVPRLYVHGSCNSHISHVPRLVEAGVRVRSVSDSDHFPAHSNPGSYYRALARFVRETPPPVAFPHESHR